GAWETLLRRRLPERRLGCPRMRQTRHEPETDGVARREKHHRNPTRRVLRCERTNGAPHDENLRTESNQVGHRRSGIALRPDRCPNFDGQILPIDPAPLAREWL